MGELFIHPQRYFVHAPAGHVAAGDGAGDGQAAGMDTVGAGGLTPARRDGQFVALLPRAFSARNQRPDAANLYLFCAGLAGQKLGLARAAKLDFAARGLYWGDARVGGH